ncbi:MAG TPA: hypothetical protein VNH64_05295 [Parvularculaceae bacterium]|nr:hypothetical protein [Parvularculaceae bacterium]
MSKRAICIIAILLGASIAPTFAIAQPTASPVKSPTGNAATIQTPSQNTMATNKPVVTEANGPCNAKFIQFVDTPLAVHYDKYGAFTVPLGPDGVLAVGNCHHIYYQFSSTALMSQGIMMGKLSGKALWETVTRGNTVEIQSLEIKGPEFRIFLKGPSNFSETVPLWVYLTD